MSAEPKSAPTTAVQVPKFLATPVPPTTEPLSCRQRVRISVFFDGTGNNMNADSPDMGHSNIARLARAHPINDDPHSVYRIYVPGIGTYFPEIGDEGGTTRGLAFGAKGQARLDYALDRFEARIKLCDARAHRSPSAKVIEIKIAVFGFSRGAALARAFCLILDKLSPGDHYALEESGRVPIEVDFLGLFDTVASVALPASANTKTETLDEALHPLPALARYFLAGDKLERQAFGNAGKAGANPAEGTFDGHGYWAADLRIPKLVKHGLHLVAGHEFRNSFPLDSVMNGDEPPPNFQEIVLPGSHSDVGGGYEPSEGGKCCPLGSLSSMVPLWLMFNAAAKFVPFYPVALFAEHNKQDFAIDARGKPGHDTMTALYERYLAKVPQGQDLGEMMLAHTRLYYAWRFRAIAGSGEVLKQRLKDQRMFVAERQRRVDGLEANRRIFSTSTETWAPSAERDLFEARQGLTRAQMRLKTVEQEQSERAASDAAVAQAERGFSVQREALDQTVKTASQARWQAQMALDRIESDRAAYMQYGAPWPAVKEAARQEAAADVQAKTQIYLAAKARLDTKANDSELLAHMREFDRQLMNDAQELDRLVAKHPNRKLRPHYQGLLEAYRDEFQRNCGLLDADVIEFFGKYVHDSLAGFGKDDTRPSDPRIVYVGGDNWLKYAVNWPRRNEPVIAESALT